MLACWPHHSSPHLPAPSGALRVQEMHISQPAHPVAPPGSARESGRSEPSGWSEQSVWSELSVQSGPSGLTGWMRVAPPVGVVGVRGGQGAGWTGAPLTPLGHCHYPPLTLPATGPLLPGHDLACHWPFLEEIK